MKQKVIICSVLTLILIGTFAVKLDVKRVVNYLIVPDYSLLAKKGYTDQEISVINSQDSVEIGKLIEKEYTKNIVKIITIPNFQILFEKGYSDYEIAQINKSEKLILEKILISNKILNIDRYLNDSNFRLLHAKGYSENEISVFDGLRVTEVDILLRHDYIMDSLSKIIDPNYLLLADKGYSDQEISLIVNADTTTIAKSLEMAYSRSLISIIGDKNFKPELLKRYIDYSLKNTSLAANTIVSTVNFGDDLKQVSGFYANIKEASMDKGYLILVNKNHQLKSSYIPNSLVEIMKCGSGKMDVTALSAYVQMCEDMGNDGLNITVKSSYRSYSTQNYLYNDYVSRYNRAYADTFSARPGHSEHQTGLALDLISKSTDFSNFADSPEFKWLVNNAYNYGFILRYPNGKENITGYKFESWHWRYIGVADATKIKNMGITFDEYYISFIK